jgi:hypothetical protein
MATAAPPRGIPGISVAGNGTNTPRRGFRLVDSSAPWRTTPLPTKSSYSEAKRVPRCWATLGSYVRGALPDPPWPIDPAWVGGGSSGLYPGSVLPGGTQSSRRSYVGGSSSRPVPPASTGTAPGVAGSRAAPKGDGAPGRRPRPGHPAGFGCTGRTGTGAVAQADPPSGAILRCSAPLAAGHGRTRGSGCYSPRVLPYPRSTRAYPVTPFRDLPE